MAKIQASGARAYNDIARVRYRNWISSINLDSSVAQTPQSCFDADFEGLASNADLYIFNQDDSQE